MKRTRCCEGSKHGFLWMTSAEDGPKDSLFQMALHEMVPAPAPEFRQGCGRERTVLQAAHGAAAKAGHAHHPMMNACAAHAHFQQDEDVIEVNHGPRPRPQS